MSESNLSKINIYEQTISQTNTTSLDNNAQYVIKDMPIGGITNAQMTLLIQQEHLGLLPVGSVFKCIDNGTYAQGKFYKYLGTSWVEEKVVVDKATYDTLGSIKLGSDTQVSQAVEQVSSIANRQYALQVDGDGRASVNVPWTDTTYSNGDGLNLSNENVFSVDFTKVEKSMAEESYTIASNSWTALASSEPFTYQTTVTAAYTIGNDTEVGIINDQAVLFANYGFIVGSVSGQNVTVYAIAQPDTSVSLTVGYRG